MRFRSTLFALLAGALLLALPAHAKKDHEVKASLGISLPASLFVPASVHGSLTCDADSDFDSDSREMMRALARQGRHGVYTRQDGDDVVRATRSGDQFRLQARDEDGQGFTLELPWTVAECLFAGRGQAMKVDLQQLKASGRFGFKLDGVEGVNLSVSFD